MNFRKVDEPRCPGIKRVRPAFALHGGTTTRRVQDSSGVSTESVLAVSCTRYNLKVECGNLASCVVFFFKKGGKQ